MAGYLFIIVCVVSAIVSWIVFLFTRGIVTDGRNSDADKQINAAVNIKKWKYISDMHKFSGGKAWLKDVGVIGIAFFQKLMNDYQSFRPVIGLCLFVNFLTAVMIYLVGSTYWNPLVGTLLTVLYIFCFWPYQAILQGGYQVLGMLFFLTSMYFLQTAEQFSFIYYYFSGICLALMMFSSASSRKLMPLFPVAFLYSQRKLFLPAWLEPEKSDYFFHGFGLKIIIFFIIFIVLIVLIIALFDLLFHRIVVSIYNGKGPRLIREIFMRERNLHPPEVYLNKKKGIFNFIRRFSLISTLYLFFSLLFFRSFSFYFSQLLIIIGIFSMITLFTMPNFRENLNGFYSYWIITKWGGRFQHYIDFFAKKGITVTKETRGAGIKWYPLFFWRMIPFQFFFYVISFLSIILISLIKINFTSFAGILIIFISLLPFVYSELSGAVQFARTYLPVFLSILLVIGYGIFSLEKYMTSSEWSLYWVFLWCFAIFSAVWNIRIFIKDILPAKMFATRMVNKLNQLGISKFFTYNTPYNDSCAFVFNLVGKSKFEIEFMKSLKEVKDGYAVIPGTSSKSSAVESLGYAIHHGDYDEDPVLNELIQTRQIEEYAVASFRTVGASKYWGQEGEVPSYRDLILKEVGEKDRYRAMAWIIDLGKLHREYFNQKAESV